MLELTHVTKRYPNGKGVKDLNFRVLEGEVTGILGSNGSGKTTTFKVLAGISEPDEGTIKLQSVSGKNKIGYLAEERSLYANATIEDMIRLVGRMKGMSKEELDEKVFYFLQYFQIEKYRFKKLRECSKGVQQSVQIICAIIHDPDLLILDEPLNGLDEERILLFIRYIHSIKPKKMILMSVHQKEWVPYLFDQIIVLDEGRIVQIEHLQSQELYECG